VPFLRSLYYDDGADHLSGCGDVEVQRLAVLGGVKIGARASVAFSLSNASWASAVQEKHLCFFRSRQRGKPFSPSREMKRLKATRNPNNF
jgi:hypothetical protein